IKFVPPVKAPAQECLAQLARILDRRLRSIDEFGWLADGQIAAILPATPVSGARFVVEEVCQGFVGALPPNFEIYFYPWDPPEQPRRALEESPEREREVTALEPLLVQPMSLAKRALDVVASGGALVLLSPLFLAVSLAIKLTSPGPVFFQQR